MFSGVRLFSGCDNSDGSCVGHQLLREVLHPPGGGNGPGRPGQLHGDVELYVDIEVEVDQVCPGELPAVQPDVAPVPNHVP